MEPEPTVPGTKEPEPEPITPVLHFLEPVPEPPGTGSGTGYPVSILTWIRTPFIHCSLESFANDKLIDYYLNHF
jgi:hypothetical protein